MKLIRNYVNLLYNYSFSVITLIAVINVTMGKEEYGELVS